MAHPSIVGLIPDLTDLELAIFICLIAQEHCLIETKKDAVDDVAKELALFCLNTFGLSYALLDCSSGTSLDDFSNGVLASHPRKADRRQPSVRARVSAELSGDYPSFRSIQDFREPARSPFRDNYLDERKVVNVVIAKNFDHVNEHIQIQALELLRSRRIFTRNAVHSTPKDFLFIPLLASDREMFRPNSLNKYLNDHLFISHFHDPQDGYPNLEDDDYLSDDQISISSVVRKPKIKPSKRAIQSHKIEHEVITEIRQISDNVTLSAEVARYLQDIVVFLRLNRAVSGGVSAKATNYLHCLAKCLAPLHGLDYITPSIVGLAAKKVYRHRIMLAGPENDRSLQYGSDQAAVTKLLTGVSPDNIIDDVIGGVEAPL